MKNEYKIKLKKNNYYAIFLKLIKIRKLTEDVELLN